MKAEFLFAGLNLNRYVQEKSQTIAGFIDFASKARDIKYLHVDTGFLPTSIRSSDYTRGGVWSSASEQWNLI